MMPWRTLPVLVLAALLPGCAFWGGDARESGEHDGPAFAVVIHNSGEHPVAVELDVMEGELRLFQDSFDVAPGTTEERLVAYQVNDTKDVRVTYAVDAGGRASSGMQDHRFEPGGCQGRYRITFEVRPDAELTMVGNHGECETRA